MSVNSIGLSIAKQLASDGAFVMISSRKQDHVDETVASLRREVGNAICGTVCHVGKEEDRKQLIKEVRTNLVYSTIDHITGIGNSSREQ